MSVSLTVYTPPAPPSLPSSLPYLALPYFLICSRFFLYPSRSFFPSLPPCPSLTLPLFFVASSSLPPVSPLSPILLFPPFFFVSALPPFRFPSSVHILVFSSSSRPSTPTIPPSSFSSHLSFPSCPFLPSYPLPYSPYPQVDWLRKLMSVLAFFWVQLWMDGIQSACTTRGCWEWDSICRSRLFLYDGKTFIGYTRTLHSLLVLMKYVWANRH